MSWNVCRVNNHNVLSMKEALMQYRKSNKHKLFRMVSKNELDSFSAEELLEWRK